MKKWGGGGEKICRNKGGVESLRKEGGKNKGYLLHWIFSI